MNNQYLYGFYIFNAKCEVKFGNAVYVYGSSPELGDWNVQGAKRLEMFNENLWLAQIYLEKHHYDYKFFISDYNRPNSENFTLLDDKTYTIEGNMIKAKNSGVSIIVNNENESDIEKYSPDFIVNCNSKNKKNSCYEYYNFDNGGESSYKLCNYFSVDKGSDILNGNILSWIKAKKYENILFAVAKTYFVFWLTATSTEIQLIKEKIKNVVDDKEKETKMIVLIVNSLNNEIANTISSYLTNDNEYNSCENDKKIMTESLSSIFYRFEGNNEIDFCKKYQFLSGNSKEKSIYVNFTFN